MTEDLRRKNEELRRRLAEAEQTIQALSAGQIDAIVDEAHQIPLLLRESQEALRASEEMYRTIVTTAAEGIWTLDAQSRTTFVNERMAAMLGYGPEEMLGRSLYDFVDEEARIEAVRYFERRKNGIREEHDFRFRRKDGSAIWTKVNTNPILGSRGEFLGALGMISDITEQRRADEARSRLAAIVESSEDAIFSLSLDGKILTWNVGAERLYGYSADEVIGRNISLVVPPDGEAEFQDILEKMRTGHPIRNLETVRRRKDGTEFVVSLSVSPFRDSGGRLVGCSSIVRDISERRRFEDERRIMEERFAKVFHESPVAIAIATADKVILEANRSFSELSGFPPDELVGRTALELGLWSEPADRLRLMEALGRDGRVRNFEASFRARSGETGAVLVSVEPFALKGFGPSALLITATDISERRRAEEQLRQAGAYARSLIETSLDPLVTISPEGRITDVNGATETVTGLPRDRLIGTNFSDYFTEPESAADGYRKVLAEGEVREFPLTIRHISGRTTDVLYNASVYRNEAGQVQGVFAAARDITERALAEKERRRLEERFRRTLDEMLEGCMILGFDWKYLYVNEEAALQGHEKRENILDRTMPECYPGVEKSEVFAHYRRCMEERVPERFESDFTFPDGSTDWFQFSVQPVPEGIFVLSLDISKRKRSEVALHESEAELKEAQRVAHVGSWSWVIETDTVTWSEELFRIAGRDPAGPAPNYTRDHATLYTPESMARLRLLVERAIRTGESYEVDLELIRPDGTTRWVADTGEARRDAKGQIVGLHGTVEDITEKRRLQEQFLHSQKMEAVGQLAGGVAHDFNNLLTVILGYCDLLLDRIQPGDSSRQELLEIRRAGERANGLTRQLLAFSRRQTLEPEILDLGEVVRSLSVMVQRLIGEHIEVSVVVAPDLGHVEVDRGQMEQVIMNLAVNSRDAMPDGGNLVFELQNVYLDQAYAGAHAEVRAGSYVLMAVSDTGVGIDAGTLKHIFEPFFTTKEQGKGTGLGLPTAYGIVRQSGGSIGVYSEPGRGTTFKIYLPRVDNTAERPRSDSGLQRTVSAGAETILLVEDEEAIRDLGRIVLESGGYTVLLAADPAAAERIASEYQGPIHLLLTDVVMPGMNGRVLADRLVRLRPELRVLFMSGYTDDAILHQGVLEAGASFLQKPFTPHVLTLKVRDVLDSRPAASL